MIFYDPPHLTERFQKRISALPCSTTVFLFLHPTEVAALREATDLGLSQQSWDQNKLPNNLYPQITKLISKNYYLNDTANLAYRTFLIVLYPLVILEIPQFTSVQPQ